MWVILLVCCLGLVHGNALDRFLTLKAVSMWPDNNFKRLQAVTPEYCAEQCLSGSYSGCTSFRYKAEHKKCDLLAIVPDDKENILSASSQGWDFYLLQPDIEAMETSMSKLQEQIDGKNLEISLLQQEKQELEQTVQSVSQRKEQAISDIRAEHELKSQRLEEQIDGKDLKISSLLQGKQELEKMVESVSQQKEQAISDFRAELEQKSQELEELQSQKDQLSKTMHKQLALIADQSRTIKTLQETVTELTAEEEDKTEEEPVPEKPKPRHCWEIFNNINQKNGVYEIYPFGPEGRAINVTCFSGWTMFQQRTNRQRIPENFDRDWSDYQRGFGNPEGEFWLGLDALHALTAPGQMTVRVELNFAWGYYPRLATYSRFIVGDASSNYRLSIRGFKSRQLISNFHRSNGMPFSTRDADHSVGQLCMKTHVGGWWFKSGAGYCRRENLNSANRATIKWNENSPKSCVWTRLAIKPNL